MGRDSACSHRRDSSRRTLALGTADRTDRPKRRTLAGLGFVLGAYGSLQVSYGQQTYWTRSSAAIFGLSYAATLGNLGYLNVIATHTNDDDASTSAFLTWTLPLGDRRTASFGIESTPDAKGDDELKVVASEQKSLPSGAGSGYYVGLASNADAQLDYYYRACPTRRRGICAP